MAKIKQKSFDEFYDKEVTYDLSDAVEIVKKISTVKFDETVDLAVNLNVDPRHAEENIRISTSLPNGTGKKVVLLVLAQGPKVQEALDAGADYCGNKDYLDKIKSGWVDVDKIIATPDMMAELGKLGKILGPKGLMPNPKSGTVTMDVAKAVADPDILIDKILSCRIRPCDEGDRRFDIISKYSDLGQSLTNSPSEKYKCDSGWKTLENF